MYAEQQKAAHAAEQSAKGSIEQYAEDHSEQGDDKKS